MERDGDGHPGFTKTDGWFPAPGGVAGAFSTLRSVACCAEVGFNHFFHARYTPNHTGDMVYFQEHASPGMCYPRSSKAGSEESRA